MSQSHVSRIECVLSHTYDPTFFYSVESSICFCRPDCGSSLATSPVLLTNDHSSAFKFFQSPSEALSAGLKPCPVCLSDLTLSANENKNENINSVTSAAGNINLSNGTINSNISAISSFVPASTVPTGSSVTTDSTLDKALSKTSFLLYQNSNGSNNTINTENTVANSSSAATDLQDSRMTDSSAYLPFGSTYDPTSPSSFFINGSRSLSVSPSMDTDALFMKQDFGSMDFEPLYHLDNASGLLPTDNSSAASTLNMMNYGFNVTGGLGPAVGSGPGLGVSSYPSMESLTAQDSNSNVRKSNAAAAKRVLKHQRSSSTMYADQNSPTTLERQGWRPRRASIANGHIPAAAAVVDQIIKSAANSGKNNKMAVDSKSKKSDPSSSSSNSNSTNSTSNNNSNSSLKHKGMGDHLKLVDEACRHIAEAAAAAAAQAAIAATNADFNGESSSSSANGSATIVDSKQPLKLQRKKRRGGILGFKELAAKAGLSAWHFHRVFRSVTGLTPKAYGEACWNAVIANPSLPVAIANGQTTTGPLAESAVSTVGTGSDKATPRSESVASVLQEDSTTAITTPSDDHSSVAALSRHTASGLCTPEVFSPLESTLMSVDASTWLGTSSMSTSPLYSSAGTLSVVSGDFSNSTLGSNSNTLTNFNTVDNPSAFVTDAGTVGGGNIAGSDQFSNGLDPVASFSDDPTMIPTTHTAGSSSILSNATVVPSTTALDSLDSFVTTTTPTFESTVGTGPMLNKPSASAGYSVTQSLENQDILPTTSGSDWSILAGNPFNMQPASTPIGTHTNISTPTTAPSSGRPSLTGSKLSYEGAVLASGKKEAAVPNRGGDMTLLSS